MADIFISYTSSDCDWAFWIAHELDALGHVPHVHEWEIPPGGDIMAWMVKRHDEADHILCVISQAYFEKPYSSLERLAAQWAAASDRPGFALPVFIEECKAPTLFAHIKRCDLYGLAEEDARVRLNAFVAPVGKPALPPRFPGIRTAAQPPAAARAPAPFPRNVSLSNIPIAIPRHFVGRDEALEAIAAALASTDGRAAVTALHGLRGVGKTTLAAAFAERHRGDYRATWWIRAQAPEGMRADLVALGVQLGWVAAEEKEQPAFESVMERLRDEGGRILLIYDNAIDAAGLKPYLPARGAARILITSNAPAWRAVAEPVEIKVWPKEIGADYLIARTGRSGERVAAETLSLALGGLALAHEQSAAYCEDLGIGFAEYRRRFEAATVELLDDELHAPADYQREHGVESRDRITVARTFRLAIEEAAKRHPAAEPLLAHAAFLAPEPIPLFLFAEAREKLGEPLASALAADGLDKAVAALRAFALVDRDSIADERDASIATDCIRLHRLVRQVAQAQREGPARDQALAALLHAMVTVYPGEEVFNAPATWPRARRLDALASQLVGGETALPPGLESQSTALLNSLAVYRHGALAAYAPARTLYERALEIRETALGPKHPDTATSLNNLALLFRDQGDLAASRPLFERALAIWENVLGPEHPDTATSLHNLALVLRAQGELAEARALFERALAISEKMLGPDHPDTATTLDNLAGLLHDQGDLEEARPLYERAVATFEKAVGPEHPNTARSLNKLGLLLQAENHLAEARALFERALAIREKAFGSEHPETATSLHSLAGLLQEQGDRAGARSLHLRALTITEKTLGPEHPNTSVLRGHLALVLLTIGETTEALALGQAALASHARALGHDHPWTKNSARIAADALEAVGQGSEAAGLRERYGIAAAKKPG